MGAVKELARQVALRLQEAYGTKEERIRKVAEEMVSTGVFPNLEYAIKQVRAVANQNIQGG